MVQETFPNLYVKLFEMGIIYSGDVDLMLIKMDKIISTVLH